MGDFHSVNGADFLKFGTCMPENLVVPSTSVYVGVSTAIYLCRAQNFPYHAHIATVLTGFMI